MSLPLFNFSGCEDVNKIFLILQSNADVNISQHVLSSHKYAYVTTLVQYYQMETRWPLRQLLLQVKNKISYFCIFFLSIN